jgi:hypothetical protein
MTRANRNALINGLMHEERRSMLLVSAIIGDDDEVDIDLGDLSEVLGMSDDGIFELLEEMLELRVLTIFLEHDSVMG